MKKISILCLGIGLLFSKQGFGQVGEQVGNVNILNMSDDTIPLPFLGQKNLLIFYADPQRPGQNQTFRDYFKTHPIASPEVASYGIINLAAAPLLPNSLILRRARKETAGTDAQVYVDPDSLLSSAWHLPGANDNFTVIFVNKDRIIEFYKAGQLSAQEQSQLMQLIDKYGGE